MPTKNCTGSPVETGEAVSSEELTHSGLDRRSLLRGAAGLSMATLGSTLLGSKAVQAYTRRTQSATTSFVLPVLPDTQFYSRYSCEDGGETFQALYGSTPFNAQTQFIVDLAKEYNVPFVCHLGDVVDQVSVNGEWEIGDAAMQVLEDAGIPYSICAGNHDVLSQYEYVASYSQSSGTDAQRTNSSEPYIQWFPGTRAAKNATFVERDSSDWHEAHIFEIFGVQFMVVSLSWRASDSAISWANDIIAANPTLPVILVSHQLLDIDDDGYSPLEVAYGEMLWDNLIADNDQIFMTLNGHYHGGAHLRKYNNAGNPVDIMVVDYQMAYQGGNGLMRLYEFDFTNNKIDVVSFSPWVIEKPEDTLNQFDEAWLTDSNHEFTISIDFAKRFAGFTDFSPEEASSGSAITAAVKEELFADYDEPEGTTYTVPEDTDDYPYVESTLAHWRINPDMIGSEIPVGAEIIDLTGNNPMTRGSLTGWGRTAEVEDVEFVEDNHTYSSAPGSIQFLNSDKSSDTERVSYFETAADAPINSETFENGYTIEAFIKFSADWTVTNNRWSNILTRGGQRGDYSSGFWGSDGESPPILFSISNLREVQWEIVPSDGGHYAHSAWSGEIMRDTWYHIAIVNDPDENTITIYVEGSPQIRSTDGTGIITLGDDQPWIIGCSLWENARCDGWLGHIGEIRVVPEVLDQDKWLTARRTTTD